jgi:glycosyltransferase involved in cell wall biosynthesis
METAEAGKYRQFQTHYFSRFDRIMVCSGSDAHRLGAGFPNARFMTVPNGYRSPDLPPAHVSPDDRQLRLILVATLGYYANADAAIFLCREVLPALHRLTGRRIQIDLVGGGAPDSVRALGDEPEVRVCDFVDDLHSLYAAADVAVIPLRAGGGTRIKILEAFAYGVPVVSTTLGAEGIEAAADEHLLLADTAEKFAQACLKVKEHPELAEKLACRGAALLAAKYSPAKIQERVAAVYE